MGAPRWLLRAVWPIHSALPRNPSMQWRFRMAPESTATAGAASSPHGFWRWGAASPSVGLAAAA